jgi:hypothetical protein
VWTFSKLLRFFIDFAQVEALFASRCSTSRKKRNEERRKIRAKAHFVLIAYMPSMGRKGARKIAPVRRAGSRQAP